MSTHIHTACRAGNACLELLWEHSEPGNELLALKMHSEELLQQLNKEQNCSGERRGWERRREGSRDPAVPRAGTEGEGQDVIHEPRNFTGTAQQARKGPPHFWQPERTGEAPGRLLEG